MAEKQSAGVPVRREETGLRRRSPGGPVSTFQRMVQEMDRMFDEFGSGRPWGRLPIWGGSGTDLWAPDVDVIQRNDELLIRADLPGMSRDDLTVDVTENTLTIQGERKREHEEEREGVYRSERSYGSFYRAIPLPEGAITDQAKASFRDGVLEITMPSPPSSKGRRIEIEAQQEKK
jgi:HSP20 family protein